MYKLTLVTSPAEEPITTAEAKTHLRITTSDDDTYIGNLITAAREKGELYTGMAFITQTWKMFMDDFPFQTKDLWWSGVREASINIFNQRDYFEIPLFPLQSITHIITYADDDTSSTMSASLYYVSAYSGLRARRGRVTLRENGVWPSPSRTEDGVEVQFVAGFGLSASVPYQIKQALLEEVAYLYENRGSCSGSDGISSDSAKKLLGPFKSMRL